MACDSDDSSWSSSSSAQPARPNRWRGAPSTWQSLTEQERGLAASLDLLRDRDLAIHLYNSFALKKWSQEAKPDGNAELPENSEEDGRNWKPSRTWTAWPLPPDRVPRAGEKVGPEDADDKYTFKRKEFTRPSRELEDVILGVTLKHAKEIFESREAVSDPGETNENILTEEAAAELGFDVDVEDTAEAKKDSKNDDALTAPKGSQRPVVSADDERSRNLLRPSIRHTLSSIDEVLEALHHARQTCRVYINESEAYSEADSDDEAGSKGYTARPRGRPRKDATYPRSDIVDRSPSRESRPHRSKSTHRGRPLKSYEPLENETQEEFEVRIARLQKKPMPGRGKPFVPEQSSSQESDVEEQLHGSKLKHRTVKTSTEERWKDKQHRLGLMDWSEVLGAASVVGLSPQVVARATQRCVNLFGEGIIMRNLPETSHRDEDIVSTSTYAPGYLPEILSQDTGDDSATDSQEAEDSPVVFKPKSIAQSYLCPVAGCPKAEKDGYSTIWGLKRHLGSGHQMTDEEIEDIMRTYLRSPNSDNMEGGVHVDNFMAPIRRFKKEIATWERSIFENNDKSHGIEPTSDDGEPPE
ncbi:RNA polymerase I-specific transcription initiation factor-domain-containing protein [Calycina marina]|uniref:RNA polymerase I-specific transcription initiation factor-domain-containing protein n=1 Tax=Calycina marina TaxID=1763456 RepID=A0A9P8CJ36_9HELO|nr:RNA polymerase I-specific transcription initiation factor-domain-containing protein [Calycina marina]